VKTLKKLIEVALPLDAINEVCAHEKQPGIGRTRAIYIFGGHGARLLRLAVYSPRWSTIRRVKWELEHPGVIPPNNIKASWARAAIALPSSKIW
jgi:putative DNA methylase